MKHQSRSDRIITWLAIASSVVAMLTWYIRSLSEASADYRARVAAEDAAQRAADLHIRPTATAWRQIAQFAGTGLKSTEAFTVSDDWAIEYQCWQPDGTSEGFLAIHISSSSGQAGLAANRLTMGHDTSYQHEAGTYWLEINAMCNWQIIIWDKS